MHLTSHITHSNGYAPYIAYYRSNGFDQRFRKLKPKPKLNPPNAHRSQIKICEKRQTQNVQFRFMPIQKSSKRVWVFRNTGANAFAKNQMRLAYEDKRDLYCSSSCTGVPELARSECPPACKLPISLRIIRTTIHLYYVTFVYHWPGQSDQGTLQSITPVIYNTGRQDVNTSPLPEIWSIKPGLQ